MCVGGACSPSPLHHPYDFMAADCAAAALSKAWDDTSCLPINDFHAISVQETDSQLLKQALSSCFWAILTLCFSITMLAVGFHGVIKACEDEEAVEMVNVAMQESIYHRLYPWTTQALGILIACLCLKGGLLLKVKAQQSKQRFVAYSFRGRPEDDVMELQLEPFDMLAALNLLISGIKDILHQQQICFKITVDPVAKKILASNHVVGDKQRILKTIGEFLGNSMKVTPSGGKLELRILCEKVFPIDPKCHCDLPRVRKATNCAVCPRLAVEGLDSYLRGSWVGQINVAQLLVSVNDTGIGIPSKDQAKLFEPYSLLTSSWAQKSGASCLELSMARRFTELAGGYIGAESKEGEGSAFYFAIPYPLVPVNHTLEGNLPWKELNLSGCLKDTSMAVKGQDIPLSFQGSNQRVWPEQNCYLTSTVLLQESRGRRILLVEDTEINRTIVRKTLQNLNLYCEEAENGQIALDFVKQGRTYDLILMDKEMPVMDGHEATRQLRLMGVTTPIVALTGNAQQSDRELFFEAGVDDFQTKPLSREKLVQLLTRFGVRSSYA